MEAQKPDADFDAEYLFDSLADLVSAASQYQANEQPLTVATWAAVAGQLEAATAQYVGHDWSNVDRVRAMLRIAVVKAVEQIKAKESLTQDAEATKIWLERQQAWKRALKDRNT